MGFTQYFTQKRSLTTKEWKEIVSGTRSIIQQATSDGIKICGGQGNSSPEITKDKIWLNGDETNNEDCETFAVNRKMSEGFQFCKTRRMPYDAVVVSILAHIENVAPGAFKLGSDDGDKVFATAPYQAKI